MYSTYGSLTEKRGNDFLAAGAVHVCMFPASSHSSSCDVEDPRSGVRVGVGAWVGRRCDMWYGWVYVVLSVLCVWLPRLGILRLDLYGVVEGEWMLAEIRVMFVFV